MSKQIEMLHHDTEALKNNNLEFNERLHNLVESFK